MRCNPRTSPFRWDAPAIVSSSSRSTPAMSSFARAATACGARLIGKHASRLMASSHRRSSRLSWAAGPTVRSATLRHKALGSRFGIDGTTPVPVPDCRIQYETSITIIGPPHHTWWRIARTAIGGTRRGCRSAPCVTTGHLVHQNSLWSDGWIT